MLLQHVGEDLQGKALLLAGLLAPLVRVHFGVGQVSIVVLVICRYRRGETDQEMAPVIQTIQQGLLGFFIVLRSIKQTLSFSFIIPAINQLHRERIKFQESRSKQVCSFEYLHWFMH